MPRKPIDSRRQQIGKAIRRHLASMTKESLVEKVVRIAEQDRDTWAELLEESGFEPVADCPKELVRWAEGATREATAPGLEWGGDYDRVKKYLCQLLDGGQADAVLKLGEMLLELGNEQMVASDESLMYSDVAGCMNVVFSALGRSSLSPWEQMKWVWTASRRDDLGACDESSGGFWKQQFPVDHWGRFAAWLLAQLPPLAKPQKKRRKSWSEPPRDTGRERLVKKAVEALSKAGRDEDAVVLHRREAEAGGSYLPLVDYLIAAGRHEEAAAGVRQGIEYLLSAQRDRDVTALRERLRQLREQERNWPAVAALQAEEFFHHPSLATYQAAKTACEQLGVWGQVRPALIAFLKSPATGGPCTRRPAKWPLPETGNRIVHAAIREPMYGVLIDIACDERDPDEALKWYDRRPQSRYGGYSGGSDDKVARVVAATQPDRAVEIWSRLAESHTDPMRSQQYDMAVGYLSQIRGALEDAGRTKDWLQVLDEFRQKHRAKSKLLRLADAMASPPQKPAKRIV